MSSKPELLSKILKGLPKGETWCSLDYVLPKMHAFSHNPGCQLSYDVACKSLTHGLDGEAVEPVATVAGKGDGDPVQVST